MARSTRSGALAYPPVQPEHAARAEADHDGAIGVGQIRSTSAREPELREPGPSSVLRHSP